MMRIRVLMFLCIALSALLLFSCSQNSQNIPSDIASSDVPNVSGISVKKSDEKITVTPIFDGDGKTAFEYKAVYPDESITGKENEEIILKSIESAYAVKLLITPYIEIGEEKLYGDEFAAVIDENGERTIDLCCKDNGAIVIKDPADLILFSLQVDKGNDTLSAYLDCDIDMGSRFEWSGIGKEGVSYKGVFDGKEHSISGLYIFSPNKSSLGFFSSVGKEGRVENLRIENSYLFASLNKYVGIFAGDLHGRLKNVSSDSTVSTMSKSETNGIYDTPSMSAVIGGICGKIDGIDYPCIENASFNGKIDVDAMYLSSCGGICGNGLGAFFTLKNSSFSGEVYFRSGYYSERIGTVSVGGIIGSAASGKIYGCTNNGKITDESYVHTSLGGICGSLKGCARITDSVFGSDASLVYDGSYEAYAGGICGSVCSDTVCAGVISRCASHGRLNVYSGAAAGIVGYSDELFFLSDSYSYSSIEMVSNYGKCIAGGAIGYIKSGENLTAVMENVYSDSVINGGRYRGAVVGFYDGTDNIFVNNTYFNQNEGYASSSGNVNALKISDDELYECFGNHKYFIVNNKKISLSFETGESACSDDVDNDIYRPFSEEELYGDLAYVLKYVLEIEDGENRVSSEFFAANKDMKGEETHSLLAPDKSVRASCSCKVFDKDHYLEISYWTEILDILNSNIKEISDFTNYGRIKQIELLTVDPTLSGNTTNAYCTRTNDNDAACKKIAYNPDLFTKDEKDRKRSIVHELCHAMSMDVGISNYLTEGFADFITYLIVGDERIDNYIFSEDGKRGEYTPTAAFFLFTYRELGIADLLSYVK